MTRQELMPGVLHYFFEPLPGKFFANSITAIIHERRAILIDTGYADQALMALEDIEQNGLVIEGIILSHFHDDHMQGLKVLPETTVYGSAHYKESLDLWTKPEEHSSYTPNVLVSEEQILEFGGHRLTLIPFPGHSSCSMLTKIDDRLVHIADELMFSFDGRPVLPSTDPGCIRRHIDSLERLKQFGDFAILPAHGPMISGRERVEKEIGNRIAYFSAILGANGKISYEEAIKGCSCDFLHKEWHDFD